MDSRPKERKLGRWVIEETGGLVVEGREVFVKGGGRCGC